MTVGIIMFGAQFDNKEGMCKESAISTIAALIRCFPEATEDILVSYES